MHNPEINARIAQYEMAFRMQSSVPELTDLSKEPAQYLRALRAGFEETAGPSPPTVSWPGASPSAACASSSCTIARGTITSACRRRIRTATGADAISRRAALVQDLKERGLLDDTLVICGGEFGRTVYSQGKLTADDYGRDHHPRCFTIWMAGGGIKPGVTIGETDDFSYNITKDPVDVHDLNATILHCLGIDHTRLTFQYQGRHFRLTDVFGNVVKQALA